MNLVEKYVYNITSVSEPDEYNWRTLICDTDCYGRKEVQIELLVSDSDYKMIQKNGYYLC